MMIESAFDVVSLFIRLLRKTFLQLLPYNPSSVETTHKWVDNVAEDI